MFNSRKRDRILRQVHTMRIVWIGGLSTRFCLLMRNHRSVDTYLCFTIASCHLVAPFSFVICFFKENARQLRRLITITLKAKAHLPWKSYRRSNFKHILIHVYDIMHRDMHNDDDNESLQFLLPLNCHFTWSLRKKCLRVRHVMIRDRNVC